MTYESAGRLTFEQRLAHQGLMLGVGNPHVSLGKMPDVAEHVGRCKVRCLKPFRNFGIDIHPGEKTILPGDLARGLAAVGTAEILPE
jgi:hypothetical protein